MRCSYIILLFLLQALVSHADWVLATLENKSDLIIDQAWHYNSKKRSVVLPQLTKIMVDSAHQKRSTVILKYKVSSQGLVFRGRDMHGHIVDIYLDGQSTHAVLWNRKKTTQNSNFPKNVSIDNGAWCARAVMQDVVNSQVLATAILEHDSPGSMCTLKISGVYGNYKIEIIPK